MRNILALMLALVLPAGAPAAEADVPAALEFHSAYRALVNADEARDAGRFEEAVAHYREAADAYARLGKAWPEWQPEVVRFRLAYCANQIETLRKRLERQAPSVPEVPPPAPPGADTPGAAPPVDPETLRAAIRALLSEDRIEEARTLTLDALYAAPDSVSVRLLTAAVQCRAGRYADAETLMLGLLEETPAQADALLLLATASAGLGRLGAAEQQLRSALDADPACSAAHYNLARLLLARTPPAVAEARAHYDASLRAGGEPDPDLEAALAGPLPGPLPEELPGMLE
ncbi:MAG: tetratricopeptide repeat protein [Lentisphaerae bacterium]|nr:tetratricopeptide repeat protein [Lentisphaerota bacterium]